jgi:beta-galactosidase/beta-glucuronidase
MCNFLQRTRCFLSVFPLFIGLGLFPTSASIPLPTEDEHVVSLNGVWRFKLEQAPPPPRFLGASGRPIPIVYPTNIEPFYLTNYSEDATWHDLAVPANWEMAGFSPATYHQPDNASGLYRLSFEVPAQWEGRQVKLNFDGVQNGCEIWCNGQGVAVDESSWGRTNYHESGWTAWQADLTPAIKFGKTNLLALRVVKNTRSIDCDTGDYFLLGGVYRPVTLFSVPSIYLCDLVIRTKLLPEDNAEVVVLVRLNHAMKGAKVSMLLEGERPVQGEPDAEGQVILRQTVAHPRLWSAEFPNLYGLTIELKRADGQKTESLTRKVGIREVSVENGVFRVNHVPVKLAGICRHDLYPTLGAAVGKEVWSKDLTLMKAANFNAIRTSHYPYGSGFYDLCDQMGFYVLDEEPFCWVDCDDAAMTPAFEQRVRETIERDKNHACVVIWGLGNENAPGRNNAVAAAITRQMDPTRPRVISAQRGDSSGADVEFDDLHYVTPREINKAEHDGRRARRPMIYTENPNVWEVRNGPDYGSLDLWGAVIDRTWRELWGDDHVAGTFLWEWQDRAVADKFPTKYYYFFPETGINAVKIKGIVDGFRNLRPEYYHVKMAQTPVAIGLKPQVLADAVVFDVTNRYSFTDLDLLRVKWRLSRSSQDISEGAARLGLQPRSHGLVRLDLPAETLAAADTLRLDFNHPDGWKVATYQFCLKPIAHSPPAVQTIGGLTFPRFNLVTGKVVGDGKGWKRWERKTAELANVKAQLRGQPAAVIELKTLLTTPLTDAETLEADVLLPGASLPAGHVRAEISHGKMSYHFAWCGDKTDVYELGWIFSLPKGVERFSWSRQAVWSYYPPDHIGRPVGTATPDSAQAQLTKVVRSDAFDFNSTKFDCDWSSLTDANGRGLCLVFSPEQRHHVRGGTDLSGNCMLIVNRCYSPPRDISTPIVPDLYTVLQKGEEVLGSFEIHGAF